MVLYRAKLTSHSSHFCETQCWSHFLEHIRCPSTEWYLHRSQTWKCGFGFMNLGQGSIFLVLSFKGRSWIVTNDPVYRLQTKCWRTRMGLSKGTSSSQSLPAAQLDLTTALHTGVLRKIKEWSYWNFPLLNSLIFQKDKSETAVYTQSLAWGNRDGVKQVLTLESAAHFALGDGE